MLPPVSPNVFSRSKGEMIWRAMTDCLKFGAYWFTISKQRSANLFLVSSSQVPLLSLYGAYCTNIDMRCLPGGATVESSADGIVHSTIGSRDGRPYFASS